MTSPAQVVAIGELFGRAAWVDVIAEGQHGAADAVEQARGGQVMAGFAAGDVAGRHDGGVGPGWRLRVDHDRRVYRRHVHRLLIVVNGRGTEPPRGEGGPLGHFHGVRHGPDGGRVGRHRHVHRHGPRLTGAPRMEGDELQPGNAHTDAYAVVKRDLRSELESLRGVD